MVVVLPEPFTPTIKITKGLWRGLDLERPRHRREQRVDLIDQDGFDGVGVEIASVASRRDRAGDARRGVEPEIGTKQKVLEILERRCIELALGEEVADARRKADGRAPEPFLEATPPGAWSL